MGCSPHKRVGLYPIAGSPLIKYSADRKGRQSGIVEYLQLRSRAGTIMKNTFISFLIGVLVGIAGHWYYAQPDSKRTVADAQESVRNSASSARQSIKDTFDTDTIRDELARTGKVIREKAAKTGEAITDAAANARSTATIKARLLKESSLASLSIHVDTTDGVVTLSGTVPSHEAIAKAMEIAMDTEGVQKVVSTLQIKTQ